MDDAEEPVARGGGGTVNAGRDADGCAAAEEAAEGAAVPGGEEGGDAAAAATGRAGLAEGYGQDEYFDWSQGVWYREAPAVPGQG
eukprot:9373102-Prorocentrum_lima.AAC.1